MAKKHLPRVCIVFVGCPVKSRSVRYVLWACANVEGADLLRRRPATGRLLKRIVARHFRASDRSPPADEIVCRKTLLRINRNQPVWGCCLRAAAACLWHFFAGRGSTVQRQIRLRHLFAGSLHGRCLKNRRIGCRIFGNAHRPAPTFRRSGCRLPKIEAVPARERPAPCELHVAAAHGDDVPPKRKGLLRKRKQPLGFQSLPAAGSARSRKVI